MREGMNKVLNEQRRLVGLSEVSDDSDKSVAAARKYVAAIKDKGARYYAERYLNYLLGKEDSPGKPALASQRGVRRVLDDLLLGSSEED